MLFPTNWHASGPLYILGTVAQHAKSAASGLTAQVFGQNPPHVETSNIQELFEQFVNPENLNNLSIRELDIVIHTCQCSFIGTTTLLQSYSLGTLDLVIPQVLKHEGKTVEDVTRLYRLLEFIDSISPLPPGLALRREEISAKIKETVITGLANHTIDPNQLADHLSHADIIKLLELFMHHCETAPLKELSNNLSVFFNFFNVAIRDKSSDVTKTIPLFNKAVNLYKGLIVAAKPQDRAPLMQKLLDALPNTQSLFDDFNVCSMLAEHSVSSDIKLSTLSKDFGIDKSFLALNFYVESCRILMADNLPICLPGHELHGLRVRQLHLDMRQFLTVPPKDPKLISQQLNDFQFLSALMPEETTVKTQEFLRRCQIRARSDEAIFIDVKALCEFNLDDVKSETYRPNQDFPQYTRDDPRQTYHYFKEGQLTPVNDQSFGEILSGCFPRGLSKERQRELQAQVTQSTLEAGSAFLMQNAYENMSLPDRYILKALYPVAKSGLQPAQIPGRENLGIPDFCIIDQGDKLIISPITSLVTVHMGEASPLMTNFVALSMTIDKEKFVKEGFSKALINAKPESIAKKPLTAEIPPSDPLMAQAMGASEIGTPKAPYPKFYPTFLKRLFKGSPL